MRYKYKAVPARPRQENWDGHGKSLDQGPLIPYKLRRLIIDKDDIPRRKHDFTDIPMTESEKSDRYASHSIREKGEIESVIMFRQLTGIRIRMVERELFYMWAFLMEHGLYSEAQEYWEGHKDEETPFEW